MSSDDQTYWEPNEQFYENEEKSKEVKKVPVFNNLDSKKCCVCKNTVYKAEELSCLDAIWHKDCFSCGFGANEIEQGEGCNKKLELGLYQSHNKVPYCNVCGDRVSKELLLKRTMQLQHASNNNHTNEDANNDEEETEEIPPKSPAGSAARNPVVLPDSDYTTKSNNMEFFQYDMNAFQDEKSKTAQAAAEKYGVKLGTDKVCPSCSKTVYKAEELIALGNTWHKTCFTCGGSGDTGCNRKLALGAYQVNNGIAYCQACNDKMARENQSVYAKPHVEETTTSGGGGNINTADDVDTDNIPAPSPRKANTYNEFQSFELSADFGKPQKENAAANKFRNAKEDATKCPQCKKTVYKAEELLAIGNVWHKACFTCGGSGELGCNRKLALGAYQTLNKTPFCAACGDRLAKEAHKNLAKPVTSFPPSRVSAVTESTTSPTDESPAYTPSASVDNFQSFELSSDFGKPNTGNAAANKFRGGRDDARKCPQCLTTVFKAEELLAIGSVWHPPCFTCGGIGELGCKRKLALGTFQTLNKHPYCNACCDRLAKEGQMMAGTNPSTASGPPRTRSNQDLNDSGIEEQNGDAFDPTAVGNVTAEYGYNNNSNATDEPDGTGGKVRRGSLSIADRSAAFKKPAWTAENDETNKRTGTGKAFKPMEDNSNKCPVCTKTVYKTEQVLALKETWHKDCFTCGGKGDLGCKRKLGLEEYRGDNGLPYCGNCYDRIHKEKYSKSVAASAGGLIAGGAGGLGFNGAPTAGGRAASPGARNNSSMQVTDPNFQSFELSDDATRTKSPSAADKFRNLAGTGGAKKCPICTKTVYQAEELIAMKMSWHKTCFTCGGDQGKGCKRRLGMGEFQGKNGMPYCSVCFDKVVKEEIANRGTGTGTTTGNATGSLMTGEEQSLQELSLDSLEIAVIDSDRRGVEEVPEVDHEYPPTPHSHAAVISNQDNGNGNSGSGFKTDPSYKFESIKFEVDSSKAMLDAENEGSGGGSGGVENMEHVLEKAEYESTVPETPTKFDSQQLTFPKSLSSTNHSSPSNHKQTIPARSPVTIKNDVESDTFETHFEGEDYHGYKLHYQSDFDENGAIYWIGTHGKTTIYQNPHNNGIIVAKMSSVFKGAEGNLLSREPNNTPTYTGNDPYSYIEIDLGVKYTMLLDKYTLRHGGSSKGNLLRNWILQGKSNKADTNNDDWVTLREHNDDYSFPLESRATASWDVEYSPQNMSSDAAMIGFRYFRITQTGFNANGNDCLFCAGIEFYGVLFEKL